MPFPISSSHTLKIHAPGEAGLTLVAAAVEKALCEAKAKKLVVEDGQISFRGGIFRLVDGWNQLLAISSGRIQFSQMGDVVLIRYRISFLQILAYVTLAVGVLLGWHLRQPLDYQASAWLWIFGGNYLLTLYRFPRFLREAGEKGLAGASSE